MDVGSLPSLLAALKIYATIRVYFLLRRKKRLRTFHARFIQYLPPSLSRTPARLVLENEHLLPPRLPAAAIYFHRHTKRKHLCVEQLIPTHRRLLSNPSRPTSPEEEREFLDENKGEETKNIVRQFARPETREAKQKPPPPPWHCVHCEPVLNSSSSSSSKLFRTPPTTGTEI